MYEPNLLDNLVSGYVDVWSMDGRVFVHGLLSGVIRDKNDAPVAIALTGKLTFHSADDLIKERQNKLGTVIPWRAVAMILGSVSKEPPNG